MRYLSTFFVICTALFVSSPSYADDLWRCPGNVYTNKLTEAEKNSGRCKPVTSELSVISPGSDSTNSGVYQQPMSAPTATPAQYNNTNNTQVQLQIDKAVNELNALEAEYNGGEPERVGPEFRNYQKYLDRVERLKNEIEAKKQEIATLRSQL